MKENHVIEIRPIIDSICATIAFRLVPKRVAYWCTIRLIAHATTGEYSRQITPDLKAIDALNRWHNK